MTTYAVFLNAGMRQCIIAREDAGPANHEGFTKVGEFDYDVDPANNAVMGDPKDLSHKGDHIFVAKAKEIIEDLNNHDAAIEKFGRINAKTITYLDRASNAPDHHSEGGFSTDDLPESENDTHPEISSQKGGIGSAEGDDVTQRDPNGKSETGEANVEDGRKSSEQQEGNQQVAGGKAPKAK